ncbi:MAG: HAMP domain-containing histidine kinase [Candidatus Eremiobacteraeota bacterium]|nr:HAMP domain-containing histidine kinase [Candidatus Eremiobacteraeota bacterium]
MPNDSRFRPFARRITRGYVWLAVVLIATIAGASSLLAFILYATGLNDSVDFAASRAEQRVQYYTAQHQSLVTYAPKLVKDEAHSRIHVNIFDLQHHRLAANSTSQPSTAGVVAAALMNVHRRVLHVDGGIIVLQPDFDAFARLMTRYWLVILPIGGLCIFIAWFAGRAITRRAVSPLGDVTDALHAIADGDFSPKLLLEHGTGLYDLTAAYNDVAYRLNAANAEQRRQSAEMRQFIADAGHELRTPLTIFMGYLDALRQGVVKDSSAVARVHDTMLDESRKMRTILEKLILLARMEREPEAAAQRVDLNSVAARAVDALKPLAGERIAFHAFDGATIVGDDAELYEAIKNVVENAVRYAPNSPVDVRVRADDRTSEVVISDRGPGMDSFDIDHAFDRFYRGASRHDVDGSGLGLAIAKRAVERVGGSITLKSDDTSGTLVTMRFVRV